MRGQAGVGLDREEDGTHTLLCMTKFFAKEKPMIDTAELKQMERATYQAATDSGLWDIFIACLVSMFAIAPSLSVHMGDFWSSAVFVPVFAVLILAIRLIERYVITPRVGVVKFALPRRRRLTRMTLVMLVLNLIAFAGGIVAAVRFPAGEGVLFPFVFATLLLVMFSTLAVFWERPRYFAYGLGLFAASFVGEALWVRGHASHHGFPVVFGFCAVAIAICGVIRFVRFLPPAQSAEDLPATEERNG